MARLDIVTHPDPILDKVAEPVTEFDEALGKLLDDMAETMYAGDGIGLAAPQVGVSKRIFVCDVAPSEEQGVNLMELVNPEIVSREGTIIHEEGCLSVPGVYGDVKRAAKVTIRFQDRHGDTYEVTSEETESVCMQHEYDHLDGMLFFKRMSPLKRRLLLRDYAKRQKELEEEGA